MPCGAPMYLPKLFREDDPTVLREILRAHSFATVVSTRDGAPFASHLPVLHDDANGGTLWGHMARANPQWRDFEGGREVLVVFQGPDAYVSPSWYREPLHVPTWNYVAVHVIGKPRLATEEELLGLLDRMSDVYEAGREPRWTMGALPRDFVEELARAIVGFAIAITRIEGKFKLSQNREPEDRDRVRARLSASEDAKARAVAAWMDRVYSKTKSGG